MVLFSFIAPCCDTKSNSSVWATSKTRRPVSRPWVRASVKMRVSVRMGVRVGVRQVLSFTNK